MERLTDIEVIAGQVHPIPKLELQNPSGALKKPVRSVNTMKTSKNRHDGGAYRRCKTMIAAHAKAGKDRSKAGKRKKGKK